MLAGGRRVAPRTVTQRCVRVGVGALQLVAVRVTMRERNDLQRKDARRRRQATGDLACRRLVDFKRHVERLLTDITTVVNALDGDGEGLIAARRVAPVVRGQSTGAADDVTRDSVVAVIGRRVWQTDHGRLTLVDRRVTRYYAGRRLGVDHFDRPAARR